MAKALCPLLIVLAALLAAGPARAVIPSGNIIVNPGSETDPGAADASTAIPLTFWAEQNSGDGVNWLTGGPFTGVQYGAPNFPTQAISTAIGGGANFFAGGPGAAFSRITQLVDVSGIAPEADAGVAAATLSGYLGGFANQDDRIAVSVQFEGAAGVLGTLAIGPITAADRGSTTNLLLRTATARVPAGTRTVRVFVTATRASGTYNDGYADNLSLTFAQVDPTPPPPPAPTPTQQGPPALPAPVLGTAVNVVPVSGDVFVSLPTAAARSAQSVPGLKGRRFIPLREARQVPVGSLLDTRKGTVRLVSAQTAAGQTQSGEFSSGVFQVLQSRSQRARGLTELRMKGSSFASCRRVGRKSAEAAARSKRRVRRLRGNATGRFRTRGRYSSATVRGTDWTVTDRCDGTLTKVTRGRVSVRDLRRKRSILLRAGKSHLAKAPG